MNFQPFTPAVAMATCCVLAVFTFSCSLIPRLLVVSAVMGEWSLGTRPGNSNMPEGVVMLFMINLGWISY